MRILSNNPQWPQQSLDKAYPKSAEDGKRALAISKGWGKHWRARDLAYVGVQAWHARTPGEVSRGPQSAHRVHVDESALSSSDGGPGNRLFPNNGPPELGPANNRTLEARQPGLACWGAWGGTTFPMSLWAAFLGIEDLGDPIRGRLLLPWTLFFVAATLGFPEQGPGSLNLGGLRLPLQCARRAAKEPPRTIRLRG